MIESCWNRGHDNRAVLGSPPLVRVEISQPSQKQGPEVAAHQFIAAQELENLVEPTSLLRFQSPRDIPIETIPCVRRRCVIPAPKVVMPSPDPRPAPPDSRRCAKHGWP